MIAGEKRAVRRLIFGAVLKWMIFLLQVQRGAHAHMRDLPQDKNRCELLHLRNFSGQKSAACIDFFWNGFVLRRHTAHGIGYPNALKRKPIVWSCVIGPLGQAVTGQRGIEKIAGIISGEGTSRAVGAFEPRRQADDQKFRAHGAEGRHRIVEVGGVRDPIFLAKPSQSRTERAIFRGGNGGLGRGHDAGVGVSPNFVKEARRGHYNKEREY